ncbi:MAG: DUF4965 domain-containing protein [Armatimonadota bacterium]|nr:DUF4965 domain-containing protein [Armatimonadota bacterium]MDW8144081.1 DUF4965 domain-containing protein [Armatimonadota bacterium]
MQLMATAVGRLGSRFSLVFDSDARQVLHSALGRWLDFPTDLSIGIAAEGELAFSLPFTRRFPSFEVVEQQLSMCGVSFVARSLELGVGLRAEFVAPFYPRDEWASLAPLFLIRMEVFPQDRVFWQPSKRQVRQGHVFLRLQRGNLHLAQAHDRLKINYSVPKVVWKGERVRPTDLGQEEELWWCDERIVPISPNAELLDDGIAFNFDLDDPSKCRFDLVWCAFVDEPVLTVFGQPASFKYRWLFTDVEAVADFACRHFNELWRKSKQMDELIENSGLTKSQLDLIRFSFQNFLLNSWWVVRDDGAEWFSVWEGSCYFHSTIDVEYNDALIYLAFWPELLELLLDEWSLFEMQDEVGSYLAHDMGGELEVGKQAYHHPMPVEENANFLLMLHCLWLWTGKQELIERHSGLAKRLTAYFERSDTTGNGFPNLGTANTIDDASPAVQYSREQTYLAVKTFCACHAAAQIANALGESDWEKQCRRLMERIRKTLDEQAWLGDHYAVCLERTADGLVDAWTGQPLSGELKGWDAYSIYTANGLLYLLLSGNEPELNYDRIRTDIANAYWQSLTEYGCTHTSADRSNVWVSQNLWRDFVAAYLDVPLPDNSSRYFALQTFMNTFGLTKGFIDTYLTNNLCFYPRGITSIGYLFALCGLQIDKILNTVRLRKTLPYPCRVPLLPLADWERGIVPTVVYRFVDNRIEANLENGEVLGDLQTVWY